MGKIKISDRNSDLYKEWKVLEVVNTRVIIKVFFTFFISLKDTEKDDGRSKGTRTNLKEYTITKAGTIWTKW